VRAFTTPALVTCGDKTCSNSEHPCPFLFWLRWSGTPTCTLFRLKCGADRDLRQSQAREPLRCGHCHAAEKKAVAGKG
jgi:hypothetical protein